jgi:hypothetical protein
LKQNAVEHLGLRIHAEPLACFLAKGIHIRNMASSTLPMQNENGEPFPWPLDMIIEILKHVAAEDPIHIFPQLCTISKV